MRIMRQILSSIYFTTFTVLLEAVVLFFALVLFGFGAGSSVSALTASASASLFSFTITFS